MWRWSSPSSSPLWPWVAVALQATVAALAVLYVPFTDIDWTAYRQEVAPVLNGTQFDYAKLRGDTGPLVYPAGFVWLYGALEWLWGDALRPQQWLFAAGLTASTALWALVLARHVHGTQPAALLSLALSRRTASLWVLRLFNDGPTALLQWAAVALACGARLLPATLALSLAVSVKMSAALLLPAHATQLLLVGGWRGALGHAALFCAVQIALALPFLVTAPAHYVAAAFELTRQFEQRWSVNGQLLSGALFADRRVHAALLGAHVALLVAFAHWRWLGRRGGLWRGLLGTRHRVALSAEELCGAALECQLIGVACARSLHYQFYAWYAPAAVALLWRRGARSAGPLAVALTLALELVYNVYPPRVATAALLHAVHVAVLWVAWTTPLPPLPTGANKPNKTH